MPIATEQRTHILGVLDEISEVLTHCVDSRERAAFLLVHFFNKEISQLMKVMPEQTELSYFDRRFLWAKAVEVEEVYLITGPHVFSQIIFAALAEV